MRKRQTTPASTRKLPTVSVLGLGYIGFPTALLIAESGSRVFGYDVVQSKIEMLQSGSVPFDEPGLTELFARVIEKQTFSASTELQSADVYIIAVPTPQERGHADLQYVMAALASVRNVATPNTLIILESTVGPLDCQNVIQPEIASWGFPMLFAHCPEKAIPGNTLHEMVTNKRVIGAHSKEAATKTIELYRQFVSSELHITTPTIAATSKVMENTYRAVNIALANTFSRVADELGFDVWEAIAMANLHPRVAIHQPGPGVGGHCIPIDPWYLVDAGPSTPLLEEALEINDAMPEYCLRAVMKLATEADIQKPRLCLLGAAYKKDVDDVREAPTAKMWQLCQELVKNGTLGSVTVVDPLCKRAHLPYVLTELSIGLSQADVAVLITDHTVFKDIAFSDYPTISLVYDTRSFFLPTQFEGSAAVHKRLGAGTHGE